MAARRYADIDVRLKRRAGAVRRLVEVVRNDAACERALRAAVVALRAQGRVCRPNAETSRGCKAGI